MGRVHRFLGVDVGVILSDMKPDATARRLRRRHHLRHQQRVRVRLPARQYGAPARRSVQRGHHYAIVDEVDSILIDEARTPLIISGPADDASQWYAEFARLATLMTRDTHYEVDIRKRTVGVREVGIALVEDQLGIDNLYEVVNSPLVGYLNNAVRAKELFHCDRDYIVTDDGEVLIVDEFTGRVLVGRRYNEGLHQAIEAKEGVEIKPENQTLATITLQNYFRIYDKLAGMTGTAQTEASEFRDIYRLGVITIPPERPMVRRDKADVVYKTELAKFNAVVDDVVERYATGTAGADRHHQRGQVGIPVAASSPNDESRTPCSTPSTSNRRRPSSPRVVGAGAVTVATDMAGRGTDIMLGGNVDFLTDKRLRARGLDPVQTPDEYETAWREERPKVKAETRPEAKEVTALGGLYILGTERHESRRIDDQLRGRSGRQGDPGETRFYLSLGDELMRRFSTVNLEKLMSRLKMPDDEPHHGERRHPGDPERPDPRRAGEFRNPQERREVRRGDGSAAQGRLRNTFPHPRGRGSAAAGSRHVGGSRHRLRPGSHRRAPAPRLGPRYTVGGLGHAVSDWIGPQFAVSRRPFGPQASASRSHQGCSASAGSSARPRLRSVAGAGAMRRLERDILLDSIDGKWREHLYEMDYLKEGIGLRAMAQRDPVVEYHSEGFDMFVRMLEAVKEQCIRSLFTIADVGTFCSG